MRAARRPQWRGWRGRRQHVRAELPSRIIDWCGRSPTPALQGMFDPLYPKGMQWYWKGDFVKDLPDAAMRRPSQHATKAQRLRACTYTRSMGRCSARQKDETAWNTRDATWSMVIAAVDPDPDRAPALKKWATDYWQAVHPHDLAGAYPNFMMADEGEARIKASFGDNYPRLAASSRSSTRTTSSASTRTSIP